MEPLTLSELKLLEKANAAMGRLGELRAVRELIALRESMEQEQQGMPWKALHHNDLVKLDKLEARHERLRKAAEALIEAPQWKGALNREYQELRAALEEGKRRT